MTKPKSRDPREVELFRLDDLSGLLHNIDAWFDGYFRSPQGADEFRNGPREVEGKR